MDAGENLPVTARTRLKRFPARGRFDRATIHAILDKAPLAHLGFGAPPAVVPMVFWRRDDHVYLHGARGTRLFADLAAGGACCFTATLLDGFVAARAALHHSVNYRSVVIYGRAEAVDGAEEKLAALRGLIERFYPGRWATIRPPSAEELASAGVFRLPIREASAKIRDGFPTPYPKDAGIPAWSGIVPVQTALGAPLLDPSADPATPPADFPGLRRLFEKQ